LYFRSLKRVKVLTLLSKYLLQYNRVCIPGIGTFEIVMLPSQLDVANKLISSPGYITRYKNEEDLSDHQLHFLSNESTRSENAGNELFSFGEKLKGRIQNSSFYWKGFGTLQYTSSEIVFEPDRKQLEAMQPVPAQKVLRENVQHSMLVGDQQMTSQQITEVLNPPKHKRPWAMIVGWILLALALIAIVLFLYSRHFQISSTGLQTSW
jgi:hypothetical protein